MFHFCWVSWFLLFVTGLHWYREVVSRIKKQQAQYYVPQLLGSAAGAGTPFPSGLQLPGWGLSLLSCPASLIARPEVASPGPLQKSLRATWAAGGSQHPSHGANEKACKGLQSSRLLLGEATAAERCLKASFPGRATSLRDQGKETSEEQICLCRDQLGISLLLTKHYCAVVSPSRSSTALWKGTLRSSTDLIFSPFHFSLSPSFQHRKICSHA